MGGPPQYYGSGDDITTADANAYNAARATSPRLTFEGRTRQEDEWAAQGQYPPLPHISPLHSFERDYSRPGEYIEPAERGAAEALSGSVLGPIYSGSDLAGNVSRGNYPAAALDLGELALAGAPIPGARLSSRLEAIPKVPAREVLPSDFHLQRNPLFNGAEQWLVSTEPLRGSEMPPPSAGYVSMLVQPNKNKAEIMSSQSPIEHRGEGVGLAMYQRLIDEAHKNGLDVHSDTVVSPSAQRIYEALQRRGYGIEMTPHTERQPNGTLWGLTEPTESPTREYTGVYKITPPAWSPQIAEILKKYAVVGAAGLPAAMHGAFSDADPARDPLAP